MRILALDFGLARIGLALSDPTQTIASSLPTIESARDPKRAAVIVSEYLKNLIKTTQVVEIVVGLPLKLDGGDSDTTKLVRAFVGHLKELCIIPIQIFDERLTTVQADRALREAQFSRKARSKKVDATTATILLQNYLDMKKMRQ